MNGPRFRPSGERPHCMRAYEDLGARRGPRSRQRKAEARRERDAEIRALLEAALEKLREGP